MPFPSAEDPLMLQKLNELNRGETYFQLDSQIQKLIYMLVNEMQSRPGGSSS